MIIDKRSPKDGTALLVEIKEFTVTSNRFCVHVTSVRVGLNQCIWIESMENTKRNLTILKANIANDGVFWGPEYKGKDPPPMSERVSLDEFESKRLITEKLENLQL